MAIDETTLHGMLEGDATHPGKVDKVSGKGLSSNDYTNAEKEKLAGIEEAANNYRLPIASKDVVGGVKTISTVTSATGYTPAPIIGGIPYYKDTVYDPATAARPGLMSPADKVKLDKLSASGPPVGSASEAGVFKVGENLKVNADDALSAPTMQGATASTDGAAGVVPKPTAGNQGKFLRGDGTWQDANNYILPQADESHLGGVMIGDGLQMVNGKLTAKQMVGATEDEHGQAGLVPPPGNWQRNCFLRGDGFWVENTYVLPEAQLDQLGGIKLGIGLQQKDENGAVYIPIYSENEHHGFGLVPANAHLQWVLRGDGWSPITPEMLPQIVDGTFGAVRVPVRDDSLGAPVGFEVQVIGGTSGQLYAQKQHFPVAHGPVYSPTDNTTIIGNPEDGLMSGADKVKLDNLCAFAEANKYVEMTDAEVDLIVDAGAVGRDAIGTFQLG